MTEVEKQVAEIQAKLLEDMKRRRDVLDTGIARLEEDIKKEAGLNG